MEGFVGDVVRVVNFFPLLCKIGITNQPVIAIEENEECQNFQGRE